MLCTTIDKSQRQCPWGTAQLLSATLGDAGGTAGQQEVLLLQGFLQVQGFKLYGHIVDSGMVEDLTDFSAGILVFCALLVLDVQGGNDLPTYQFPDVHFMHTANPRHSRQLAHYNRQERTTANSECWDRNLEPGVGVGWRGGYVPSHVPQGWMFHQGQQKEELSLKTLRSHNQPCL